MKSSNQEYGKHRTILPFRIVGTLIFFILGAAILKSQSPPPGQPGGNAAGCACYCGPSGTPVVEDTKCSEECVIVEALPPNTYTDIFIEESEDCVSGFKNFSQKVTITGVRRKTNLIGKVTVQMSRLPKVNDPNENCNGCPPCSPLVETSKCGEIFSICAPRVGDLTTVKEPKIDKGCVSTPV